MHIYIYIYIYIYIIPSLSAQDERDTRSIFKRSLTGLNPEFSFSYIGCDTKIKEDSLPYYFFRAGGIPFSKVFSAIRNANSLVQDLNLDPRVNFIP